VGMTPVVCIIGNNRDDGRDNSLRIETRNHIYIREYALKVVAN
jgi:hypothetical protein